ncbi:class I SAM-dependent methyltransferase [Oceanicoccus sp. KOV_DT_Chl]|uniref:class I SAM-dependent methyltransferase n=1 Tax=Oceanicoccus sp. KOV_DT_Chl TaxID=1904639 RepID=UPI00190EC866|nr:methyltransferase domain-containing protein [Oceanicoccus sp. KOV_DT_Chl]
MSFINQSCADSWPVDDHSLDVIFTSNFLEHLPDKVAVETTIEQAQRCLKPGGKIICLGPNIKYLPGEYWDFWDHHVPISEHSLAELLELKGFSIQQKHAKFLPYTMSDGNHPNLFLVKLYLKIPLVWKILGKQFLIVATRNSKTQA